MRKKVLYVDTPLEPPGGGQQSLLLILEHLDKDKFQPVVFIPDRNGFEDRLTKSNIECKIVTPRRLFFEIKKFNTKIIHCNSATTRYTFYTALVSKLLCIPFIWHVRVMESAGWKDRVIAKLATKIIIISDAVKKKFSYIKDNKIIKIYNAVDTVVFKPGLDIEYLYKEFNIDKSKKAVGIFSRLHPLKGHKLFIDAAKIVTKSFESTKFLIVGEGEESYKKELFEYIENRGLKSDIVFTGFRKDMPELMNLCDVIVSTSIEPESFGRTIIEAMACAKPVIATNIGGPREIITHLEDGYLTSLDSEEIAQAIILFLTDTVLATKVSTNARRRAEKYFSINSQIQQIENLYREVLQS